MGKHDFLPNIPESTEHFEFFLWDLERGQWWRQDHNGYTRDKNDAGRYSTEEMIKIVVNAAFGGDLCTAVAPVWAPSPQDTAPSERFEVSSNGHILGCRCPACTERESRMAPTDVPLTRRGGFAVGRPPGPPEGHTYDREP